MIYLNEISPVKPPDIEISILVKSYDKKTVEKCRNINDAKSQIVSKLSNISVFDLTGHSSLSIIPYGIHCPSKSVMVGPGQPKKLIQNIKIRKLVSIRSLYDLFWWFYALSTIRIYTCRRNCSGMIFFFLKHKHIGDE